MVGACSGIPIGDPASPTDVNPVRIGNMPVMKLARIAAGSLTRIPALRDVPASLQAKRITSRPMRFTSSAHPSTTTHTLLREKQGHVDLERPLRRNLVIVIDGVVSDLAKQVDRLLAELHDSPHPGDLYLVSKDRF